MRDIIGVRRFLFSTWFLFFTNLSPAQPNVWTYHNDNSRTGANTNETILTPGNVTSNSFGKLFSHGVDGYVYAQPLYVANVAITNKGLHNTVFVATEHDSVYAFDADGNAGSNSAPLWQVTLLANGETTVTSGDVGTTDIVPEIGITGTPVIDVAAGTLYVVAKSKQVSGNVTNFLQRLHALNIASGTEKSNSPVLIQASVQGTGDGADGSNNIAFNALTHNQRSGLLLLNGVVYISWASHGDNPPYHGWIIGYDEHTLTQVSVFNTTPNGSDGGVWAAGGAPAADTNGNIFFLTGNGTFDAFTNNDFGDSVIRLTTTNAATNLALADYFTPYNQATLNLNDTDLGSGGALLLPDSVSSAAHPHLLVGAGKGGTIYLMDSTNLGQFNSANDNQTVQHLTNAVGVNLSTPAYFNNRVYYMAYKDYLKAFLISNGLLSTTPVSQSTLLSGIFGATASITANGTNNAIAWILLVDAYKTSGPAVLHAYDAYNLTKELYNSSQAGTRDQPGGAVKFTVPTVVNGKVYVGTESNLAVFGNGIFTAVPIIISQPQSLSVPPGTNITFYVGVLASNGFTTQWLFDGTNIPGATATNYTLANVQATNAGNYSVVVSNASGTATSALAFLSVVTPLTNSPGAILAPPGLVNWWPADGNALDIFGGNNGTPQNGFSYAAGEFGLAFHFDGATGLLNVGASNLPPPWTACMWVNRKNALASSAILMADGTYSLKLEQYNLTRKVGITQLAGNDFAFNYSVPTNTWVHLAFVGTSSSVTLFANGISQGSIPTNNFPLPRTYIGAGFATSRYIDYMLGSLDDILVFSRALTAGEIASIYAAGSAGLVRAPSFTSEAASGGQFTLNLSGLTGKTFSLYTSTNLTDWTPLITLSNPAGTNGYTDSTASNTTKRFFRVSQP